MTTQNKMAKIGGERAISITIKLSTWKKLKILNTNRKEIDATLSDTLEYLIKEAKV